jgi:hypothetical protein
MFTTTQKIKFDSSNCSESKNTTVLNTGSVTSVADQHRFDADPNPDPKQDPTSFTHGGK